MLFKLKVHHFYGSNGAFIALVSKSSTCAFFGLLHIVGCKKSVDNRNLALGIELSQSLSCASADVVEVRSVASNNAAYGDNGVELSALAHLLSTVDKFETSRNHLHFNVVFLNTMLQESVACSLGKCKCYVAVPLGNNDAELLALGIWN